MLLKNNCLYIAILTDQGQTLSLKCSHLLFLSIQKSLVYTAVNMFNSMPCNLKLFPDTKFKNVIKTSLVKHCSYTVEEFYDVDLSV